MGRRSFGLSWTAINRMISASNARAKERERINLINSQTGTEKELPPEYSFTSIDFNENNRITKIEITQTQQYRTIDRYVTQDHVRYPIYSNWKTRSKTIKKSIKLTNRELEQLDKNDDNLIRMFAKEIVLGINNPDLLPSWFIRAIFIEEYTETVNQLNLKFNEFRDTRNNKIKIVNTSIDETTSDINLCKEILSKRNKSLTKTNRKLNNIEKSDKKLYKYVVSLFIYAYFISDYRKNKLIKKQTDLKSEINAIEIQLKQKANEIENLKNQIATLNNEISEKNSYTKKQIENALNSLKQKQASITPLPTEVDQYSSFTPLKTIIGIEYQKIIGCYVIHNRINGKCYAGQSKDVWKRLHQHFKGTVPSNTIFAEDYYLTPPEKREDLFEVKIIPCLTKDELDKTEKDLIEEYDAFNNGYNGTNGNT